ncbi:uncharacterized protein LOC116299719 [Actinia tenebrosa]|uniref:Uncharacterized protein LOC116299719 n=1 Tax=Actinia tenebrosa TaxID=6105 RepID=A0A6P8IDH9_ACTTE|nr:uncharacterized protein LOC116299719 [Actinia tenebrosa]
MKMNWIILLGLVIGSSPFAQNSGLTSKTVDTGANRRDFEQFKKTAKEYEPAASELGKMMSGVLSMVGVDNAVSISLTNNHQLDLTDPHWYIVDGKFDAPPPDVLRNNETMVITFERHPSTFWGLKGTEGVLTYNIGNSYLLIVWSAVWRSTNRLLVKIINQDPNPGRNLEASTLFKTYKKEAWEAGDYGKWHFGTNTMINCKFIAAMGNGDKAPLQVFLS